MRLERSESQRLLDAGLVLRLIAREQTTRFTGGSDCKILIYSIEELLLIKMKVYIIQYKFL